MPTNDTAAAPSALPPPTSAPQKRALPVRKTFLANAVLADLENELTNTSSRPTVTGEHVLLLTNDTSLLENCEVMDGVEFGSPEEAEMLKRIAQKDIETPSFCVIETRTRLKGKQLVQEDTSDEAYLKRHRKHELAEKKLKNRERERLAHELYQQQLTVERLRNMDRGNLLSIATALRRADGLPQKEAEDIDALHRRLLREAEDQLKRYEMLGLGDKRRTGITVTAERGGSDGGYTSAGEVEGGPATGLGRRYGGARNEGVGGAPATRKRSLGSTVSEGSTEHGTPVSKRTITTKSFLRPKATPPPGGRKSSRVALAFGQRLPFIPKREFRLPDRGFGELMSDRT